MKAAVYSQYGPPDVVAIQDLEKPSPGENEVLIKVRAASVNPADWRLMRGRPYAMRLIFGLQQPSVARPARLGVDVAGEVEAVGSAVSRFNPGDEVFGCCRGAFAEYACAAEAKLAGKPGSVSFEQAAAVPVAALTAFQGLGDKGRLQPGQKVLINGAAGGVGTFAVQIAKWMGAEVSGVCSTRNLEMVRALGADRVIDYTREDFTTGTRSYDLILDNVGNHSLAECRRVLKPGGVLVIAGGPKQVSVILLRALGGLALSRFVSQKILFFIARINSADLTTLADLMTAGKVTPVIDRRYTLNQAPEALRYSEEGHARGKVVLSLA